MPVISRFFGIVIAMYYRDHQPPHFHALYGGYQATVEITTGAIQGDFPPRAARLVEEWLELHRSEVLTNWEKLQKRLPLDMIAPLE